MNHFNPASMKTEKKVQFTTQVSRLSSRVYDHHLPVPDFVVDIVKKEWKAKRLIAMLDSSIEHRCALMPAGDYYYILLNKEIRNKLKASSTDQILVTVKPEEAKYGMEVPLEWQELLDQDPETKKYFELLTPGKKRNLLHIMNKVKSDRLRLEKSIIISEHLKRNKGTLDFKQLRDDFKQGI